MKSKRDSSRQKLEMLIQKKIERQNQENVMLKNNETTLDNILNTNKINKNKIQFQTSETNL